MQSHFRVAAMFIASLWIGLSESCLGAAAQETSGESPDQHQTKIRITNGEWAPFLSEKLPGHGFASEIVRAAFAAEGVTVEWGFFPWGRSYALAKHGEWDAAAIWKKVPAREVDFLFSEPVIKQSETLVCRQDNQVSWTQTEDLAGLTLGVPIFGHYPFLDDMITAGTVKSVKYPTYEMMYRGVLSGRVDCAVMNPHVHEQTMLKYFDGAEAKVFSASKKPLYSVTHHLMISRNIANGPQLLEQFNKGLRTIRENGQYHQIIEAADGYQYIDPELEP